LLTEFYREKEALWGRHVAVSRVVAQYDHNNTYQYVVAREEQHLTWVREALQTLGGDAPPSGALASIGPAKGDEAVRRLMREDSEALETAVAAWRERIRPISDARNKLMLELTLGEMLEQARLFKQATEGDLELLGRRTGGDRTGGAVLPARWVE
jgi:hypothetical protein